MKIITFTQEATCRDTVEKDFSFGSDQTHITKVVGGVEWVVFGGVVEWEDEDTLEYRVAAFTGVITQDIDLDGDRDRPWIEWDEEPKNMNEDDEGALCDLIADKVEF